MKTTKLSILQTPESRYDELILISKFFYLHRIAQVKMSDENYITNSEFIYGNTQYLKCCHGVVCVVTHPPSFAKRTTNSMPVHELKNVYRFSIASKTV